MQSGSLQLMQPSCGRSAATPSSIGRRHESGCRQSYGYGRRERGARPSIGPPCVTDRGRLLRPSCGGRAKVVGLRRHPTGGAEGCLALAARD